MRHRLLIVSGLLVFVFAWLSVSSLLAGYAVTIYPFAAPDEVRANEARKANEVALKIEPLNADSWFGRALYLGPEVCFFSESLCEIRLQSLHAATARRPLWTAPWALLAQSYMRSGQPRSAIAALKRANRFGAFDRNVHEAAVEVGLRQWPELGSDDRDMIMGLLTTAYRFDATLLAQTAVYVDRVQLLAELIPEPRLHRLLERAERALLQ
jgi:hypothetical protein